MTSKVQAALSSEASIRQKGRQRMQAVGDEALIDLDDDTAMLIAKRQ